MQSRTTCDRPFEMNESLDNDIFAPSRDTVHGCTMRADVVGADFPIPRIIGNLAKEDNDGIAGTELVFSALYPGGPFVDWSIRGSGHCLRGRRLRQQDGQSLWCWDGRLDNCRGAFVLWLFVGGSWS